jgi:hypothetical protein
MIAAVRFDPPTIEGQTLGYCGFRRRLEARKVCPRETTVNRCEARAEAEGHLGIG